MLAAALRAVGPRASARALSAAAAGGPSFAYEPADPPQLPRIVRKSGIDLLHDPLFNKVCVMCGRTGGKE
jgi:hypothetical protein